MRLRILPHQIDRILGGRYHHLHHRLLGVELSDRAIEPIHRHIYYVDARDPMGRLLIRDNTPAKCLYHSGEIFCLYDERIPLTETRLVHEFIHRVARRRVFFRWSSGLDRHHRYTLLNEAVTEYLTSRVIGSRYNTLCDPRNSYLPFLAAISKIEQKTGCLPFVQAYLNGNIRFFQRFKRELDGLL